MGLGRSKLTLGGGELEVDSARLIARLAASSPRAICGDETVCTGILYKVELPKHCTLLCEITNNIQYYTCISVTSQKIESAGLMNKALLASST